MADYIAIYKGEDCSWRLLTSKSKNLLLTAK